jgi:hypothetical protein
MKKNYQKPTLQVVQLQQQTQVLQAGSEYDVIPPGQPNEPAAARAYRGQWDDVGWDKWEE